MESIGFLYLKKLQVSPSTGLPHDIMHDLFEGVVPYQMKLLLFHCVGEKFFTIDELNEQMAAFDFCTNKPSEIDANLFRRSDSKLRQSASQMMTVVNLDS